MKKFLAFLVAVLMIMALVPTAALAAVDVTLTGGGNTTAAYNESSVFIAPSIEVNDSGGTPFAGASVVVNDLPEDCTIGYTNTPDGITVTVRDDNKVIRLTGSASAADYQQALRGIYVNTGTTAATATFDITIGGTGNVLYNSANQHFYKYVNGSLTWQDAKNFTDASNHFGLQGYLATITSKKENDFVSKLCGGQGWLGGSDADTEDTWKWVTGPEEDKVFWKDGGTQPGEFSNWQAGLPNGAVDEDYMYMIDSGRWYDLDNGDASANGYVVEYGGMAGDPVMDVSETCRLTITAPYNKSSVLIAPTIELNLDDSIPLSGTTIAVTDLPEDCTIGHTNTPDGITVTVREDNKIITLTGTASVPSYQQALRGIYINTGTTDKTVTFDFAPGNVVYNSANQHYYEYVAGSLTWQDANNGAQSRSYFGLQGYLGTITSKNENDFVATYCGGQGWLGASDADTEDTWKWVCGPEAGTMFWRDGYKIAGQYSNFISGEPNDEGPNGEDYMHIYGYDPSTPPEKLGQWCDFHHTNSSIKGYVVEYGGTVGDPEVDVVQTYQLTLAPSKHTVSFNSHGGSAVSSVSNIIYGSTISEPSEPTRAGYDFAEWYKTIAYNTQWNFSTDTVSSDFTLHAKWAPRNDTPFAIEHYKQDADGEGYTLADTDNLVGTTDALVWATAFAKTYTGFTENTTHPQRIISGTIAGDGSLKLKLYYDLEQCTVTFNKNTTQTVTSMPSDQTVRYGGKVTEPDAPSSEGFVFMGWYKESACTNKWAFATDTVDANTTLYAKWSKKSFAVTYNQNTTDTVTSMPSNQTMWYGDNIEEPSDPLREDFAFIGWYKDSECTNKWAFATDTVKADTMLYAKWSKDKFKVIYDNNGGSGAFNEKQYDGVTFMLHDGADFNKDGYVIDGWDIEGTQYELGALYTMVSNNVTAQAIWAADSDNDGISDEDETAAGTDPFDEGNTPQTGTVRVKVLGSDGSAKAGLTCVLNSQPETVVTDANGIAIFKNVALAPHTLSVRSSDSQLGTYSIGFSKGSKNGTTISDSGSTDSIGGVTATVTSTFLTLDLTIKQSSDGQWAIDDSSYTEKVPNPTTGSSDFAWLWICVAVVVLVAGCVLVRRRITQK